MTRALSHADARNRLGSILVTCAEEEHPMWKADSEAARGTLRDLATAADLDDRVVATLIESVHEPSASTLEKVARYLEVTMEDALAFSRILEWRPA